MGMGVLEAFDLIEEVGAQALRVEDVLWAAQARKRRGCRLVPSQLTAPEVRRVLALGRQCSEWKARR